MAYDAGWQRFPINRQCEFDVSRDVYFIDGTRAEHVERPDIRQHRFSKVPAFHEDGTPMSVCYTYVKWLGDAPDKEAVHAMYSKIEMWVSPSRDVYLYRATQNSKLKVEEFMVTKSPCQKVTLDLLDPDLAAQIQHWRLECLVENAGMVRKVVARGPLSFQEPPDYDSDGGNLSSILQLGELVELPSVESQTLTHAYESATGFALQWGNGSYYVPNLPSIPTILAEEVRIGSPSVKAGTPDLWLWPVLKLVDAGVLTVTRMVFNYAVSKNLGDTTRMIMDPNLKASSIPVFIAVKSIDFDLFREIEATGVKNFIVPESFQLDPPDMYEMLEKRADQIIYRAF